MKQKEKRHARILEIIRTSSVETQDELTDLLNKDGFATTQATVSRDIKELQLIKTLTQDNTYKYSLPQNNSSAAFLPSKYFAILRDSVLSVEQAQNIVVVRCYAGMAQAACAAIDSFEKEDIVGTIAGDDTIFLATKDNQNAKKVVDNIREILGNSN